MFVGTTEAATLLQVCARRVRRWLEEGRIQGARKIARAWVIPLYKGQPRVKKGTRGPKPRWATQPHCANYNIHINRHNIAYNKKHQTTEKPVVSVKRGSRNLAKGSEVEIHGPSRLVYQPNKPLDCGATVWIETFAELTVYDVEGMPIALDPRWVLEPG
ncbi:helix-turn-helix domain-containing protein [Phormidium sp. CCY1219]|jgi:hypothetical protein|uniref:helix-turn-helix domain-containing protein n=1 Tax=Phormidium sp. CCY1219 TaxID=2886104 RepID=UPI002D1F683B|nr:helix-turn-helix domain-containing protein [Phormidium sp. CCY1219]MEB3831530.1 helix-turn-helix domain-containing protein [Phormidium sp. CCY1219]